MSERNPATVSARATGPCNCRVKCMDADDEDGVCKGLPEPPKPPLVEIVLVRRDRG